MDQLLAEFFHAPIIDRVVNFSFVAMSAAFVVWTVQRVMPYLKRIRLGDRTIEFGAMAPPPVAPQPVILQSSEPSLIKHRIFSLESEFLTRIDQMNDGSTKAQVNVAFLKDCKFKSVYKHLRKFIESVEASNGQELEKFPVVLHHITQDYAVLSRSVEFRIGSRIVCGIPTSYQRKFDRWHDPHVTYLMTGIREILRDPYYYSWWATATACLDLLLCVLHLTLDDAATALAEINGELDKDIAAYICKDQGDDYESSHP